MIRNATIRQVNGRNASGHYTYNAVWADDGIAECELRYIAPPGRFESYQPDDVVMVACPGGDYTAGRIIGLFEAAGQQEPEDEGNTEMAARDEGDIRLVGADGQVLGLLRGVFSDATVAGIILDSDLIILGPKGSTSDYNGKGAARLGDTVQVTIPVGSFLTAANGGVLNAAPVTVDGEITSASSKVAVAD